MGGGTSLSSPGKVMSRNQFHFILIGTATVVTGLALFAVGFDVWIPDGNSWVAIVLLAAGIINSILIYTLIKRPDPPGRDFPQGKMVHGRQKQIAAEFRHEMERFIREMGESPRGSGKTRPNEEESEPKKPPPPVEMEDRPVPSGDLILRIAENMEILGGYREDLSTLLGLYRLLYGGTLSGKEREKTISEIKRFEKVVALPFLLEDSTSVHEETILLVERLSGRMRPGAEPVQEQEEWTPIELHDQIEQVIRSLPEETARSAWFEREIGDMPPLLSRSNTLFEALYHVLDFFIEAASGGRAIHIRSAQRGEDAWIGISIGPVDGGKPTLMNDERIKAASDLWKELGGSQTIGNGELQILLPVHGPTTIFSQRVTGSA